MKFEKITDAKIKISISLQEIQANHLTIEEILANSINSQTLLEALICKAESEIGFVPENAHLLIEVLAPSNKECVFTITKLLDNNSRISSDLFVYKFNKFDDFMCLCKFLNNFSYLHIKNFSKNFSLIFYNNTYFLRLLNGKNLYCLFDFYRSLFSEFGEDVSNVAGIDGYLNEYGKIIFPKNAISKGLKISL